jgi:hypothetical protein
MAIFLPTLRNSTFTLIMNIEQLPTELALQVLEGLPLQDILSISRVSKHFRTLCCSNRSLWKVSQNARLLNPVLPFGSTVESVDPSLLLRSCARALALHRKWTSSGAAPLKHRELTELYRLPEWWPWNGGDTPRPRFVFGGQYFMLWRSRAAGIYSIDCDFSYLFDVQEAIADVDLLPEPDGSVIVVLLLRT